MTPTESNAWRELALALEDACWCGQMECSAFAIIDRAYKALGREPAIGLPMWGPLQGSRRQEP